MGKSKKSKVDVIQFTKNRKYQKKDGKERTYEQKISCKKGDPTCTVTENDNGDKTTKEMSQAELFTTLIKSLQDEVGRMFKTDISLPMIQKALQGPDIPDDEKFEMLFMDPQTHQPKIPEIPDDMFHFLSQQPQPEPYESQPTSQGRCPFAEGASECPFSEGSSMDLMGPPGPFGQPYMFNDDLEQPYPVSYDTSNTNNIVMNQSVPDIRELNGNLVKSSELVQDMPISLLRKKASGDNVSRVDSGDDESDDDSNNVSRVDSGDESSDDDSSGDDSDNSDHSIESIIKAIEKSRKQPVPDSDNDSDTDSGDDKASKKDSENSDYSLIEAIQKARQKPAESDQESADTNDTAQPPDWIRRIEGDTQKQLLKQLMGPQGSKQTVSQEVSPMMIPASELKAKAKAEN